MRWFALTLLLLVMGSPAFGASLTWTDNSDNEDGFRIYRADDIEGNFTLLDTVGPNITNYVDLLGSKGQAYRVTAFNSEGESQPSNNAWNRKGIPGKPTDTKATP